MLVQHLALAPQQQVQGIARLARVLLDLAEAQGQPLSSGTVITSQLTQSDLAHLCGLTRESTNKWLRSFARDETISYEDGRITLLNLEDLRANAD